MEQEGETRFKELFENMSSGAAIYSATDDGTDFMVADFNWAGELIERKRKDEVIGKTLTEAFPEASEAGLLDVVRRVWSTANPEYRLISLTNAEGANEWRENHIFKLPSGEVVNVYNDITETKRTEEALRQSEEKWSSIAKNAANIIITVDRTGTILFINHTIDGADTSQVIGRKVQDFAPPEYTQILSDQIEWVFQTGESARYEGRGGLGDMKDLWHEVHFGPIKQDGKIVAVSLIANDIGQRKQAEEALKESEEKYRTLIENATTPIAYYDLSGHVIFINASGAGELGKTPDEVIGKSVYDILPDIADRAMKLFRKIIKSGKGYNFEDSAELDSGLHWYMTNIQPVRNADGEIYAIQVISQDITEHKQAEEALKYSEEKFRGITERCFDGIMTTDIEGRFTYVSPAVHRITGFSHNETEGKSITDFFPEKTIPKVVGAFSTVMQGNSVDVLELEFIRKDGTIIYLEAKGSPIFTDEEITGTQVIFRDITSYKQTEAALMEGEVKYRTLIETANYLPYSVDNEGTIIYVGPQVNRYGYSELEVLSRSFFEFVDPEDQEMVTGEFISSMEEGKEFMAEFRMIDKSGNIHWFEDHGSIQRDESGNITGLAGMLRNITERKLSEKILHESETKYRGVVERANDGICIIQDGLLKYVNPQSLDILGHTSDEMIGTPITDYIHPDSIEMTMDNYKRRLAGEDVPSIYESALIHKNGKRIDVEINAGTITYEGSVANLVIIRDITNRKKAQQTLRESEEKFQIIFENANDEIIYMDKQGTVVDRNMKGEDILGIPFDEVVGKNISELGFTMPEEQIISMVEMFDHAMKMGKGSRGLAELGMTHRNGSSVFVEASVSQIRQDDDQIEGLLFILRDITERKHAEEQILQRNRELTALNAIAQTVSQSIDLDEILNNALDKTIEILNIKHGSIAFWEEAENHLDLKFIRGFGDGQLEAIPQPEIESDTFAAALQSEESIFIETVSDLIRPDQETAKQLISKQKLKSAVFVPLKARGKTLGVLSVATQNTRIFTAEEKDILTTIGHAISTAIENTQLLEAMALARELEETERLRTAFFASVSHELRTPLTSIKGLSSTLMQPDVEWNKETQSEFLETIDQETDRMAHIITDILDMSKIEVDGMNLEKNMASLESVISAISNTLSGLTAQHDLELLIPKGLPLFLMDEVRIGQVITNLVGNAASYSPEGTKITIEAESLDDHIIVTVTDKGAGMPSEEIEQIFDLFYRSQRSVKLRRGGSGLGLPICKGIVEAHGGVIRVESEVGKGSKFIVTLSINT